MATHDLAQAKRLATRVLFLHCGRVQEDTESVEFFARPRSEAAARFLAGEILD
jgi:tungstate transport system ATP-binding protein